MAPSSYTDPDNEHVPLVSSSSGGGDGSSSARSAAAKGVLINRLLIILILAAFVTVSIFFEAQSSGLSDQLQLDESRIQQLERTIDQQAKVIERFNSSVSNTDVLKELRSVEKDLESTRNELTDELDATKKEVNSKLTKTMAELDATVKDAESEIQAEVDTVKKDFEQYVVHTQDQFSMENSFMVYQLAGTFTLLSCLISMWHMTAHLRKMNQPFIQRKILAILWMSPIYAITSWFSLVFHSAEGYLAIIKDGYEAYVIYQFLSFCIAVLGKGDREAVVDLLAQHADHLTPPFRLFFCCRRDPYENDRSLASAILLQCQFFALQFVFLRPLTTIATVVLKHYDYFGPWGATSASDYRSIQFYIILIQNLSVFTAFAGLLKFYHAVDKDLAWCRPFAKFLCIKGVVFMTFWQGLAITLLAETTDVGNGGDDADEWAMSAQNFLICLEMLLFSIAHFYCFPTEEWEEGYKANHEKGGFGETLALGDFMADLKLILTTKNSPKKKKKGPSESSIPEEDEESAITGVSSNGSNASENGASDRLESGTTDHDTGAAMVLSEALSQDPDEIEDPELKEARNRLIASGFLNDLGFGLGFGASTANTQNGHDPQLEYGDSEIQSDQHDETDSYHNNNNWDAASENTGLLSNSSAHSELRPSIFTTIANLSQRQEEQERTPRKENDQ